MPVFSRRILSAAASLALAAGALAQGTTAFSYQGKLTENGTPVNGVYDIKASLFNFLTGGTQLGTTQCFDNVQVTDGLFIIQPDFGNQYASTACHLEIQVRADSGLNCSNATGYTLLGPRTRLIPTPYAVESFNSTYLGGTFFGAYARVDIPESFAASVTMFDPLFIEDTSNVVVELFSSNDLGCRMSFESSTSARTWSIGATGNSATEGGDDFAIVDVTSNVLGLIVEGVSGNVGIGTINPNQRLDVIDGTFRVASTALGGGNVFANVTAQEHGLLGVMNENGNYYVYAGQSQWPGAADIGGQLFVGDANGSAKGGFQMHPDNNCTMFAQVKSFVVDNPDDETTDLYYACVEGPEAAMYVRGTAQLTNGEAIVTLPRRFTAMALAEGITVQITPLSADCNGIAVVKKGTASIAVKELMRGSSNASFDWEVKAVRAGFEDFEVVRPKSLLVMPKPDFVPVN